MIYVNGDSWSQRSNGEIDYSWPNILETKVNCSIINQSAGCGSNSRVLSNLYKLYQSGTKISLIIIGLSSFQRFHLPSKLGSSWNIGPTVINDRFNNKNDDVLHWYQKNVFDEVEFVYQFYNQIWQMHELSTKYFQCPIIFFNAWDPCISKIHQQIFYGNINKWIEDKVEDTTDYSVTEYIKMFEFFKIKLSEWNLLINNNWHDFLTTHIDGPADLHPGHPSPAGHRLIAEHILTTIQEQFPIIYQELERVA